MSRIKNKQYGKINFTDEDYPGSIKSVLFPGLDREDEIYKTIPYACASWLKEPFKRTNKDTKRAQDIPNLFKQKHCITDEEIYAQPDTEGEYVAFRALVST